MPLWVHEWIVAPTALALAFIHAARALGAPRAAVELGALVAYGFALEWVAMAVFQSHRYSDAWTAAPAGVPVAVAVVWAAVISAAMTLAVRAGAVTARHRAALAASLGISLDLLMEPVAMRLGLWQWTPPGPWLGVPVGNFVGWAVIVGGYTYAAERWAGSGPLPREAALRLGVAAGAIAALVGVGLLWTVLEAESTISQGAGWAAWLVLVTLPPALARARHGAPDGTLAARLAGGSGRAPAGVFALVALTFAVDALAIGDGALILVAAATFASLAAVLARARRGLN